MNNRKGLSRREFLKLSGLLTGFLALNPQPSPRAAASSSKPEVVHTYSSQATSWDSSTGWWGIHVDQGSSPIDVTDPNQQAIDLTGLTISSLYDF